MKSLMEAILLGLAVAITGSASASDIRIANDPAAMLYYQKPLSTQSTLLDQARLGLGVGMLRQAYEPGWFTPAGPYRLDNLVDFGIGRYGVEDFRVNDVIIWAGEHIDISREEDPRIQPSQWAWVGIVAAVAFGASCAAGGFPCNSFMDGQTDLSQVGEEGFLFKARPRVPAAYDRVKTNE